MESSLIQPCSPQWFTWGPQGTATGRLHLGDIVRVPGISLSHSLGETVHSQASVSTCVYRYGVSSPPIGEVLHIVQKCGRIPPSRERGTTVSEILSGANVYLIGASSRESASATRRGPSRADSTPADDGLALLRASDPCSFLDVPRPKVCLSAGAPTCR